MCPRSRFRSRSCPRSRFPPPFASDARTPQGRYCVSPSSCPSILAVIGDNTCSLKANENNELTLFGHDPVKSDWLFREGGGHRMWGHMQMDEHFIDCIREGRQPSILRENGRPGRRDLLEDRRQGLTPPAGLPRLSPRRKTAEGKRPNIASSSGTARAQEMPESSSAGHGGRR